MKKPKIPQTIKELDTRISELKDAISLENKKMIAIKSELKEKEDEAAKNIKEHEILIEEYNLLLKHYQEERVLISNPSSRNGRNKE